MTEKQYDAFLNRVVRTAFVVLILALIVAIILALWQGEDALQKYGGASAGVGLIIGLADRFMMYDRLGRALNKAAGLSSEDSHEVLMSLNGKIS